MNPTEKKPKRSPVSSNIALGAATNVVLMVVTVATSLWVSPRLLHGLGDVRYGVWTLVAQLTGYFGVLDFGTRSAIGFFVSRDLARQDLPGVNRVASTAVGGLAIVGLAIVICSAGLAYFIPVLFNIQGVAPAEVRGAAMIMGAAVGLALPFDVFGAVLTGSRRQHFVPGFEILTRVLTTILMVIALERNAGLPVLGLIQLTGRGVAWLCLVATSFRVLPELRLSPRFMSRATASEISSLGAKSFVINLASILINRLDAVVIGAVLGMASVTVYSLGQLVASYAMNAVSNISVAFSPQFAHLAATKETARMQGLLLSGTRIVALLTFAMGAGLFCFGSPFLELWIGAVYVTGNWAHRSDVVLWLLVAAQIPKMLFQVSWRYLFNSHQAAFLAKVQVLEAISNVVLSLVLVRILGLPGVALGTLIPLLINNCLIIPAHTSKVSGIRISRFVREALAVPFLLFLIWLAAGLSVRGIAPPTTWGAFILGVSVSSVIMVASAFGFGLSPEQRGSFIARLRRSG